MTLVPANWRGRKTAGGRSGSQQKRAGQGSQHPLPALAGTDEAERPSEAKGRSGPSTPASRTLSRNPVQGAERSAKPGTEAAAAAGSDQKRAASVEMLQAE